MGQPGVIFGGPSSEHDVSILTALPAARTLPDATAVYWSKTGDFFEVDTSLEAKDFLDGAPRRSTPLRLVAPPPARGGRRALPRERGRPGGGGPPVPGGPAVGGGPGPARRGLERVGHIRLRRQVPGRGGHGERTAGASRPAAGQARGPP